MTNPCTFTKDAEKGRRYDEEERDPAGLSGGFGAAVKLGYAAAEGGQAAAYEQIYLAKFVHQHWSSFQGQFDGLINLDYNFLGMDLASQGSTLFKQITTGGWPVSSQG